MRAYELMVIAESDVDDAGVTAINEKIVELTEAAGGTVVSIDLWGRRRFAYPIDHKFEGTYTVFEITASGGALDEVERYLRLADEVVRHKVVRLPDIEAERRGLLSSPSV